jgi:hypothetical protein
VWKLFADINPSAWSFYIDDLWYFAWLSIGLVNQRPMMAAQKLLYPADIPLAITTVISAQIVELSLCRWVQRLQEQAI